MRWNKIRIETTTQAEEMVCYELQEMGIGGVEVEDHVALTEEDLKTMYVDLLPDEIAPDDGNAAVICYVEEGENLEDLLLKIRNKMAELSSWLPVGSGKIPVSSTEEEDWVNNWKAFFKPFRLDDNIVIKPTWETLDDRKEDDIVIEIDPGTAFGSGSHETTKLCISMLKKYVGPGKEILDVGTGSGILSIIALKLGAEHADGTDIDPNAIRAVRENFEVNHIRKDQAEVYQVNLLDDREAWESEIMKSGKKYDVIVANILADVIIPLSAIVKNMLKEDGIFIASGIIDTMEKPVCDAFLRNGFDLIEVHHMKDWVSVVGSQSSKEQL